MWIKSIILLLCTVSSAFGALEAPVNGTVWDNVSGLMWQQGHANTFTQWGEDGNCPSQGSGPTSALCYCDRLERNSHTDWRLPDRNELQSIVDYARADPAINPVFPTLSSFYWTSTTFQEWDSMPTPHQSAWAINFNHGGIFADPKIEKHRVRCVRGRLYRITSTAVGPGTITPDVAEAGDYGTEVNYTITPDGGESIQDVLVDGTSVGTVGIYTFPDTTAGRHTIIASFSTTRTITVTNDEGCIIDPVGPTVLIADGNDQDFTYGASDHFTLDDVLVNGASVIAGNPTGYTFTNVSADHTIETQCTEETKNTLTVVVTGPGTVTSDPVGISCADGSGECNNDYYASESVTLTAVPDTDMIFSGWGGACTGTGTCVVTMDTHQSVTAIFTLNILTVTPFASANGTIAPSTPQAVNHGGTTTFTVTPDEGYTAFVGGTCGGTLVGDTYTTNPITANCTVVATFTLNTYTVTPFAGEHGSIAPSTPQTINHGSTTTFTVTPDEGYSAFVGGTCGGTLVGDIYTTNAIIADCSVIVAFSKFNMYLVTASAGQHGTISPYGAIYVNHDDILTFTLTPDDGYRIDKISGCNGTLAGNTYTTGNIIADCEVTAAFTAKIDFPWAMFLPAIISTQ